MRNQAVFTTGEVAKLARVSQHVVLNWCDKGLLSHYVIPGSRHRRVLREDLMAFLKQHAMPTGELEKT